MNPLTPRQPLLRRILSSRLLRWPIYLFLLLALIGVFVPEDESSSLETARRLHSTTNPWRDLPAGQETARKQVLFIAETLRDTPLPTSLPDEDDYEFLSRLLRSLETRDDISWTTLLETGAERTVMAIANRPEGGFAPEPYGMSERVGKLHAHWVRLAREEGKPERWEAAHDTTFVPPLPGARSLAGEGAAAEADAGGLDGAALTDEQREGMEVRYAEWGGIGIGRSRISSCTRPARWRGCLCPGGRRGYELLGMRSWRMGWWRLGSMLLRGCWWRVRGGGRFVGSC